MKLLITTQVYENYAWNEDGSIGTGENAYWKPKGGSDYVVKNFRGGAGDAATTALMLLRDQIEKDTPYYREQIIDWKIVTDDYLTQFEKDQLEYEGKITYPANELIWE